MRKTIDFLGWVAVLFTILTLILTLLTTYQFTYVKYFDSYYTLQWCIFFTMFIWGIKMFDLKSIYRNIIYPIICMVMAACTIVFILMKVY